MVGKGIVDFNGEIKLCIWKRKYNMLLAMSEVHSSLVEYEGLITGLISLVALGLGKMATLKGLKVSCNNVELFHQFMNDGEVVNEEVDYLITVT